MSVLLDTGVLVGKFNPRDDRHEDAQELVARIAGGELGAAFVTTYVVDETLTLLRARDQPHDRVRQAAGMLGLDVEADVAALTHLLPADPVVFHPAVDRFLELADQGLSFTDCTTLTVQQQRGLDAIATFDDGFDGLAPTVP